MYPRGHNFPIQNLHSNFLYFRSLCKAGSSNEDNVLGLASIGGGELFRGLGFDKSDFFSISY